MNFKVKGKQKYTLTVIAAMLCVVAFVLMCIFGKGGLFSLETRSGEGEDFVKFIDVGQGDSILFVSNGYSALLDTGPTDAALDLTKALTESGVESIDVLMLSHLHVDHTGGVNQLFKDFEVKNVILPQLSTFSEGIYAAQRAINRVTEDGGGVYTAVAGMNFKLGDFEITVLAAYTDLVDENNSSLIIMAELHGKRFLFMGDAEIDAERKLLKQGLNLNCDVIKAGHHGSSTSSCREFLKAASPSTAVITCGKRNSYNHPHRETLNSFKSMDIDYYRTDKHGDITFSVKDNTVYISTEK